MHCQFRFLAPALLLTLSSVGNLGAATTEELIEGIRRCHTQLVRLPDGWRQRFQWRAVSDPSGSFASDAVEGEIRCKWPKLYSKASLSFKSVGQPGEQTAREGSYNFDSKLSLAVEGKMLAQASPLRHLWSAVYLYPLICRHFSETHQLYFPGKPFTTDIYLPHAFDQHGQDYRVGPVESVAGVRCVILERPNYDKLWVAPDAGYVVCRREIRTGPNGVLRQRTEQRKLREVAEGIWVPMLQLQEEFDVHSGEPYRTWSVSTKSFKIGGLRDEELTVVIPEDVHQFENLVDNTVMRRPLGRSPFDTAVQESRLLLVAHKPPVSTLVALTLAVTVVMAALAHRVFYN